MLFGGADATRVVRGERFLINPFGWHWSEITASSLVLCDAAGNVLEGDFDTAGESNPHGFNAGESAARGLGVADHDLDLVAATLLPEHFGAVERIAHLAGDRERAQAETLAFGADASVASRRYP